MVSETLTRESTPRERATLARGTDSTDLEVCRQATYHQETMLEAEAGPSDIAGLHRSADACSLNLMASVAIAAADVEPQGPFEGPEKLLELWFADSPELLPPQALRTPAILFQGNGSKPLTDGQGRGLSQKVGLRAVPRNLWEDMLDLVKCKVLSVVEGQDVDAYLLSESSMFVFPHKIILKTCGTTTLLLGLRRLLELARCSLTGQSSFEVPSHDFASPGHSDRELGTMVRQCFYSRKSFMFPERQKGPHKDWMLEVRLLEAFFEDGSAYTVGKMNGDHWLLFMCCPGDEERNDCICPSAVEGVERPLRVPTPSEVDLINDQTLEILMTHLSPASCAAFEFPVDMPLPSQPEEAEPLDRGHSLGIDLSAKLGLTTLFPNTHLDAFAFDPCGYSANAVIPASSRTTSGYWTIHVTPEQGSSYASFESNVALRKRSESDLSHERANGNTDGPRDLPGLIRQVVDIFKPGKMSITLFTSSRRGEESSSSVAAGGSDDASLVHCLRLPGYTRKDRIAYEFESYDLVFCHFETTAAASGKGEAAVEGERL